MNLYFDESGNTGTDLLNREQPVAALASTALDADDCRALLSPMLVHGQTEAKYSRLKGSRWGRCALLQLFSNEILAPDNTKAAVADKRFYLITHLVDKLIEPTLYEQSIDLYAGDGHVNMVRMFYYAGPLIFPGGDWDLILAAFVQAIRQRSSEAYAHYDEVLERAVRKVIGTEYGPEAAGLFATRGRLSEFLNVFEDMAVFDPMPDLFIMLVNRWMEKSRDMFDITHDVSKPLRRNEAFLRLMMTPIPNRQSGYGNRKAELPLRISDLRFAGSHAHAQLQFSDLVAGAVSDLGAVLLGYRERTPYHDGLRETRLPALVQGCLLPSPKIERANDPGEGEVSLVDGAVAFFREAKATQSPPSQQH